MRSFGFRYHVLLWLILCFGMFWYFRLVGIPTPYATGFSFGVLILGVLIDLRHSFY